MSLDPKILSLCTQDWSARQSCQLPSSCAWSSSDLSPGPHPPSWAAMDGSFQGWDRPTPLPHPLPSCRSASGQVPGGHPELRAGWRGGDKTSQVAPGASGGNGGAVLELFPFLLETSGVNAPNKATLTPIQQGPALGQKAVGPRPRWPSPPAQSLGRQLWMSLINKKWGDELIIM